jgi:hypothetical protein
MFGTLQSKTYHYISMKTMVLVLKKNTVNVFLKFLHSKEMYKEQ